MRRIISIFLVLMVVSLLSYGNNYAQERNTTNFLRLGWSVPEKYGTLIGVVNFTANTIYKGYVVALYDTNICLIDTVVKSGDNNYVDTTYTGVTYGLRTTLSGNNTAHRVWVQRDSARYDTLIFYGITYDEDASMEFQGLTANDTNMVVSDTDAYYVDTTIATSKLFYQVDSVNFLPDSAAVGDTLRVFAKPILAVKLATQYNVPFGIVTDDSIESGEIGEICIAGVCNALVKIATDDTVTVGTLLEVGSTAGTLKKIAVAAIGDTLKCRSISLDHSGEGVITKLLRIFFRGILR